MDVTLLAGVLGAVAALCLVLRLRRRPPGEAVTVSSDVPPRPTLEVHLEELGEHSWVRALLNTLGGTFGSAQYRFVARPPGGAHRARDHVVTGATFPVMRLQDLDDRHRPNAWVELAEQRLDELDQELRACGWSFRSIGQHWWSRTYEGPERVADAPDFHVIPGP